MRPTSRRRCTGTGCAWTTGTTARTRRRTPIPVGGGFTYRIDFPDPGVYWYHPHIREDYGQELGLYGNILVVPADPDYWPPAHREVLLTLDDVLIEHGKIAAFARDETTHAAMGRFGNVMLVGGETELALDAQLGEIVRFYLTNTANTRVFNVAVPEARMKLVGGDSGRVEREELVDSVILAPSERVVVDVLFERPGRVTLEHRTPQQAYPLAAIEVADAAGGAGRSIRVAAPQPGVGLGAPAARSVLRFTTRQDARARRGAGPRLARRGRRDSSARCTRRSSARRRIAARNAA